MHKNIDRKFAKDVQEVCGLYFHLALFIHFKVPVTVYDLQHTVRTDLRHVDALCSTQTCYVDVLCSAQTVATWMYCKVDRLLPCGS